MVVDKLHLGKLVSSDAVATGIERRIVAVLVTFRNSVFIMAIKSKLLCLQFRVVVKLAW